MADSTIELQQPSDSLPASSIVPHRRPRVREVSSRFMSPVNSMSVLRQSQEENISETARSLETPLVSHTHHKSLLPVQKRPRASVKSLFKENGKDRSEQQQQQQTSGFLQFKSFGNGGGKLSRPDTPMLAATDRIIPSRYKLSTRHFRPQTQTDVSGGMSDAAKLLQANNLSFSDESGDSAAAHNSCQEVTPVTDNDSDSCSVSSQRRSCMNYSVSIQKNKGRTLSELRSSMPEADTVHSTVSKRWIPERSSSSASVSDCESSKFSASPCFRSLNLPEHSSLLNSVKLVSSSLSKASTNAMKMQKLYLPPNPTCAKVGADVRKGKTVFNHQEEIHSLKLLQNHYLQWRFANAKAEASMDAQKLEIERKLYSTGLKISDLRNTVSNKRIEHGLLQRTRTLSTVLEAQMRYLEEWSAFEEEYSTSLSEATSALLNSSLRLPVSGNIRADTREVGEALNSATKVLEMIYSHVQSFMPEAEKTDTLSSQLASVTNGERALIEECGNLISRTYTSQVEEFSLRGNLIQFHRRNHCDPQEE